MIIPERLLAAIELRGLSQAALAREVGISTSMINKLARGESRESAHIYAISKALSCTPEYLSGDSSDIEQLSASDNRQGSGGFPVSTMEQVAAEHGLLAIRHLDLAFGMGATYIDNAVEEEMRFFPEGFIRSFTNAPAELIYFAEGAGDSMMPTIHSRDVVIIDASDRRITMADQIWACTYSGMGMIKRLRPMPDGGVKIMSDNPSVQPETAYDGELSLFGRVVGVARKI